MSYSSRVVYTATGGQTQFDYPFPYLDKAHIHVLVAGTEVTFSWVTSSRIALTTPATAGQSVSVRRTTPVSTPLANFQNGSVLTGPDLQLAVTQSLYRDEEITDDILDIGDPSGTVIGGTTSGVTAVNGRSGAISLSASDVLSGFGTQVGASLSAGLGITLSTSGGITTITAPGGGGGSSGVATVNGRSGNVSLSAADVTSGFGSAVASSLVAGSGVSLSTTAGVTTIAFASAPVASVNGRTGAVSLTAADVSSGFGAAVGATLASGAGISIATVSGITTITNTGGGGGGSTPTPNEWSTTDHTTAVTLSNANETVTYGTIVSPDIRGTRGTTSRTTGKVYFEASFVPGGTGGIHIALGTIDQDLTQVTGMSGTNNGFSVATYGLFRASGASFLNNTWIGFPRNVTIQVAADLSNKKVWFKPTSGTGSTTWNNDATADPATGVGGLSYTGGPALYPISASGTTGDVVTLNTGATTFAGSPPVGFTAWDSSTLAVVTSVNGRVGGVNLTAADVSSGFGAAVGSSLAAGGGISISTSGGVTTITNTSSGGAVSSVAGRTGAVTLTASDVSSGFGAAVGSSLAAGAGVSLVTSGGVTTVSASGSLAYQYTPAWENGITTGNLAATNTTNLQSLINALSSAGGGTIWFNAPGPYQINSTITLRSNVSIRMTSGAYFSWTGSSSGTIFQTDSTTVHNGTHCDLFVNEGGSFSGVVFRIHSAYRNTWNLVGFGSQAVGGRFIYISADSTGTGGFSEANHAFNKYRAIHLGTFGTFLWTDGLTSGIGGNPQVVTLNNFEDLQGVNGLFRGIKLENWSDTNHFSGQTRMNMSGANSIGLIVNEANSGTPSVYNTHFENLAVDTFGGPGLARYGVVLNVSKGITCDKFYQLPAAEVADFYAPNCTSYQFRKLNASDNIYIHQKNVSSGL